MNKHPTSQYFSEFIGTFALVFFGCGAIISSELNLGLPSNFIPLIFGAIVTVMIYSVGHISGAHFNPAVTLAFFLIKKMPAKRVPYFILAQVLGSLKACLFLGFIFGHEHSFGQTLLKSPLTPSFCIEFLLTFFLMFVITAVATDSRAQGQMAGMAIGLTVTLGAFIGGPLTGASLNPARSLGPAILASNFTDLWVYLIAPILGALGGAIAYNWIRCQTENTSNSDQKNGCC